VNDLPRVATRQSGDRESNPRLDDFKSSAQTTHYTRPVNGKLPSASGYKLCSLIQFSCQQGAIQLHAQCNSAFYRQRYG